jgi:hypothetical protein
MLRIEHLPDAPSLKMRVVLQFVHKEAPGDAQQYSGAVHIDGHQTFCPCGQRACHGFSPVLVGAENGSHIFCM